MKKVIVVISMMLLGSNQIQASDQERRRYTPVAQHCPRIFAAGTENNDCKCQTSCCCYPLIACADCVQCAVAVPLKQCQECCKGDSYELHAGCKQVCYEAVSQWHYKDQSCLNSQFYHPPYLNCCFKGVNRALVAHQGAWECVCYIPKRVIRPLSVGARAVMGCLRKGCQDNCCQRDLKERQLKNQENVLALEREKLAFEKKKYEDAIKQQPVSTSI